MKNLENFYIPIDRKNFFGKSKNYSTKRHQEIVLLQRKKSLEKYKEIITYYKKVIAIVSIIINELSMPNTVISFSLIIARLINKGYLSDENYFSKITDLRLTKDIPGFLGIDVIGDL